MFNFEFINDRQEVPESGVKYFGCKRDWRYSYQWIGWNGKPILEEKTAFVNIVGICVKAEDSDYDAHITKMQVIEFNCRANPASILDLKNPRIVWETRIDFLGIDPEETVKAVLPRRFWKAARQAMQAAKSMPAQ